MTLIAPIKRNMQTKFELNCSGDNLDDDHLAKNIVVSVKNSTDEIYFI